MIINNISGFMLRKFSSLPYPKSEYVIIYFEAFSKKYPGQLISWDEFDAALGICRRTKCLRRRNAQGDGK